MKYMTLNLGHRLNDSKDFHLNTFYQNLQNEVYDFKSWSHTQV